MPPRSRSRLSLTAWTFIACLLGLLGGRLFSSHPQRLHFLGWYAVDWAAHIFLSMGNWLAFPLIFASIATGANGLEPMRGVGRVAGKTALWIVGSSGIATLLGLAVAQMLRPATNRFVAVPSPWGRLPDDPGSEVWIVCVLVAVAVAIYRNQIEETRARLLLRFATAVDETLTLLLDWARRLLPPAVFLVAFSTAGHASLDRLAAAPSASGLVGALILGWSIYSLLVLPLVLFAFAGVSPWRYARAVGAAILTALAGAAPPQVFPLTLDCVRTRAGISNRVGGLVLAGCTALLRDGQVLGWSLVLAWFIPPMSSGRGTSESQILLAVWLLGCTNSAGPATPFLLCGFVSAPAADRAFLLGLGLLIEIAGNAVSVFSHTCAAAVIARSEGETNFLPNPPRSTLLTARPLETLTL